MDIIENNAKINKYIPKLIPLKIAAKPNTKLKMLILQNNGHGLIVTK